MELIHIVRTRHVQSINNVHRLNMGVKSKNFWIVKEQTLSQLSYGPVPRRLQTLVGLAGVAPATSPLSGVRSN